MGTVQPTPGEAPEGPPAEPGLNSLCLPGQECSGVAGRLASRPQCSLGSRMLGGGEEVLDLGWRPGLRGTIVVWGFSFISCELGKMTASSLGWGRPPRLDSGCRRLPG